VAAVAATGCVGRQQAFRPLTAGQSMPELDRIVHERVDSGRSTGIVAGMVFPDGSARVVAYDARRDAGRTELEHPPVGRPRRQVARRATGGFASFIGL